jgi:hypothetical protein
VSCLITWMYHLVTELQTASHSNQLEKLEESVAAGKRELARSHRGQMDGWVARMKNRLEGLQSKLAEEECQM